MTTFDYTWKSLSPAPRLSQSETHHNYAQPSPSPDSEYFDISAAWYNHPEPYTAQPHSPLASPSRHIVPELSQRYSANPALTIVEGIATHCSSCGLISAPAPVPSLSDNRFGHICADIAIEQECPDTHSPSLAQRRASLSRNSPTHHRRRHSSLYEPASQPTAVDSELLERKDKLDSQESCPTELASNPYQQESRELNQASPSLEQDSKQPKQEPHHTHDKQTDFYAHTLASLIAPLELEPTLNEQEPHHIHDKGTDFYAHTLTSLVNSLEQDYSPVEKRSDPFEADIHAVNEASPTNDPYYQTPAARLSLEETKQDGWTRHSRWLRAQRQIRLENPGMLPVKMGQLPALAVEGLNEVHAQHRGEPGSGFMREQYYGKCL